MPVDRSQAEVGLQIEFSGFPIDACEGGVTCCGQDQESKKAMLTFVDQPKLIAPALLSLGLHSATPSLRPFLVAPHSTSLVSCTAKTIVESDCEAAVCKTATFKNPNQNGNIAIMYKFCGQDSKTLTLGPGESTTKICKIEIATAHLTGADAGGTVEWTIQ